MSMGYGAAAKLVEEDGSHVLYNYCGYTLNEPGKSDRTILDGEILIAKEIFTHLHFDYKNYEVVDYVKHGLVQIKNCQNTWRIVDDIDTMAMRVFWHIYQKKQLTNLFPTEFSLNY